MRLRCSVREVFGSLFFGLSLGVFAPQVLQAQSLQLSQSPPSTQPSAAPNSPRVAELKLDDDALTLSADFDLSLSQAMEDALARGVALYFVLEIEVTRARIFLDETVANRSETFRVAYVPLTRNWRISSGLYTQNLASLESATRQFSRLRGLKIIDRKWLQKGEKYTVTARLRHDANQLPKPLQVGALATRDWVLDIEPVRLTYVP